MKKHLWVSVLGFTLLGGCAQLGGDLKLTGTAPVVVDKGQIAAGNVLIVGRAGQPHSQTWELAGDNKFSFPPNGIVFEGEVVFPAETVPEERGSPRVTSLRIDPSRTSGFVCAREDRLKFTCATKQLIPGIYKYTVRVQGSDSQVLKIDPGVIVMPK